MNNTNNENKDFIANRISNNIINLQSSLIERVIKQADFGFVSAPNFPCLLAVSCLLEHALDNVILYSNSQFSNILNLYNKVIYAANV